MCFVLVWPSTQTEMSHFQKCGVEYGLEYLLQNFSFFFNQIIWEETNVWMRGSGKKNWVNERMQAVIGYCRSYFADNRRWKTPNIHLQSTQLFYVACLLQIMILLSLLHLILSFPSSLSYFYSPHSFGLRYHFWQHHDHHASNVRLSGQISRDDEQCERLYENPRRPPSLGWASVGLRH